MAYVEASVIEGKGGKEREIGEREIQKFDFFGKVELLGDRRISNGKEGMEHAKKFDFAEKVELLAKSNF